MTSIVLATTLVGMVGMVGCSPGSSPGGPSSAHATDGSTTPTVRGKTVAFSAYGDNDGPTTRVVVTGAIGDYGRLVSVKPDGSLDPDHNHELLFDLTRGTFRVDVTGLGRQLASEFAHFPPDRVTCSGRVTASRRAPVIAGGGTGAYADLSGVLSLTITIDEVDKRRHCGPSSRFLAQSVVILGHGTIS